MFGDRDDREFDLDDFKRFHSHTETAAWSTMSVSMALYIIGAVVVICIVVACCCRGRRSRGHVISGPPPPAPPAPNVTITVPQAAYPQQQYAQYPVQVTTTYPAPLVSSPYPGHAAPYPAAAPYPTGAGSYPMPAAAMAPYPAPSAPDSNALPPSYEQAVGVGVPGPVGMGVGGCEKQSAYNPHAPR